MRRVWLPASTPLTLIRAYCMPRPVRHLYSAFRSFDALENASHSEIQGLTGRKLPFALELHEHVAALPKYHVHIEQIGYITDTQCARVMIECSNHTRTLKTHPMPFVHIIVGTLSNELLFYERVRVADLPLNQSYDVASGTQVKVFMIDERTVGCDVEGVTYLRYGQVNAAHDMSEASVSTTPIQNACTHRASLVVMRTIALSLIECSHCRYDG
jgi:hypothetical protein